MIQHFILGGEDGHQLVRVSLMEWAEWYEHADRVVAQTGPPIWRRGPDGKAERNDGITVSTVFVGIDHHFWGDGPALLFETQVFGGEYDGSMDRYPSWATAEAGHKRWVAKVFPALSREKAGLLSKSPK